MVLIRLLTTAFTLTTGSLAFALPSRNATLSRRDPGSVLCGEEHLSLLGFHEADESLIASNAQAQDVFNQEVPVFWRVIYKDETYEGGYLDFSQIHKALDALNDQFGGSGFHFVLYNTAYEKNETWFDNAGTTKSGETQASIDMKKELHVGTARHLTIYTVGMTNFRLLGYAMYPWWYKDYPERDGVVIKWNTHPGGTEEKYNEGKTLTHEVGHWLGLHHTFNGGCYGLGDEVADTPAEIDAAFGCPIGRDTCPGGGDDPIHNYMDYTDESCKTDPFSLGQIARMRGNYLAYRGDK